MLLYSDDDAWVSSYYDFLMYLFPLNDWVKFPMIWSDGQPLLIAFGDVFDLFLRLL